MSSAGDTAAAEQSLRRALEVRDRIPEESAQELERVALDYSAGTNDPNRSVPLLIVGVDAGSWRCARRLTDMSISRQRFGEALHWARQRDLLPSPYGPGSDNLNPELEVVRDWEKAWQASGISAVPVPWQAANVRPLRFQVLTTLIARPKWSKLRFTSELVAMVVDHVDGQSSLLLGDRPLGDGPNMTRWQGEPSIALRGSPDDCRVWSRKIMRAPSLYAAALDRAQTWAPGITLPEVSEILSGLGRGDPSTAVDCAPGQALTTATSRLGRDEPPSVPDQLRIGLGNDLELRLRSHVLGGEALDEETRTVLRWYVREIEIGAGQWGPFKSICKLLEAQPDLADIFGIATVRLSWPIHSQGLPGYTTMTGETENPPSILTLNYLRRRFRRATRDLPRLDTDAYVRFVVSHLSERDARARWRGPFRYRCEPDSIQHQYEFGDPVVADQILYGRPRPDAPMKRYPDPPPPGSERHCQRMDPHPEVWNGYADELQQLLAGLRRDVDTAAWAFLVLSDLGAEIPACEAVLGLESDNPAFQRHGLRAVLDQPETYPELSRKAILGVLSQASGPELKALLSQAGDSTRQFYAEHATIEAARQILGEWARTEVLDIAAGVRVVALVLAVLGEALPERLLVLALRLVVTAEPERDLTSIATRLRLLNQIKIRALLGRLAADDSGADHWLDAVILAQEPSNTWTPELVRELLAIPSPSLVRLGWRLAAQVSSDRDDLLDLVRPACNTHKQFIWAIRYLAEAEQWETQQLVIADRAERAPEDDWQAISLAVDAAVAAHPPLAVGLWEALQEEVPSTVRRRIMSLPSAAVVLIDALRPQMIGGFDDGQYAVLDLFLRAAPARFSEDDEFAVAVATAPDQGVSAAALSILKRQGRLEQTWLHLMESGTPRAVMTAERYVASIKQRSTAREAILTLLDSGDTHVRSIGLRLLEQNSAGVRRPDLVPELSEHRSPAIWQGVAAEITTGARTPTIREFDQMVLRTRRRGRAAKKLVQERLLTSGNEPPPAAERQMLAELAEGAVVQDREWALRRMLMLAESGADIPGLEVGEAD